MRFILVLFNLRSGEDNKETVLKNIKSNIPFRGANLWILACAILIASVGLNVNSTAVIIGAMLISPLMGPIVGAGFALGIFDFPLLKKSLLNLLVATVVGLTVSTLYFFLTPFKEAQSELIARTAPNIYDVLIAFFGGLVGVIAVTRVDKGNPIPGVAIATALMPPLCTAGFGLAIGNWSYFGGALFLYAINCTFICIATYIIVKVLHYPAVMIDKKREKNVHLLISLLVVLIIVPSIYFAYTFFIQQQFEKSVNRFIAQEFEDKGNTVIYKRTNFNANPKTVELAFLIRKFSEGEIQALNKRLPLYQLANTRLYIRQDSTFLLNNRKQQLENERVRSTQDMVHKLQQELSNYRISTTNFFPETKVLFPEITAFSIAKMQVFDSTDSVRFISAIVYKSDKPIPEERQDKLKEWVRVKLNLDTLEIYRRD